MEVPIPSYSTSEVTPPEPDLRRTTVEPQTRDSLNKGSTTETDRVRANWTGTTLWAFFLRQEWFTKVQKTKLTHAPAILRAVSFTGFTLRRKPRVLKVA